ncbi:protein lingerer isoform X3 [Sipha flava]|uniref:Protein lingerer n=2 Tax=Sipha flava TaxID=143950 RepID=A0A2S2Q407_9HEMI|nr:protein lingerer isoform X3 [Sipha flava]
MSGAKGNANRNAKTSGKNSNTNAAAQIAETKDTEKLQPTPEQLRIAKITDPRPDEEIMREKVTQVMTITQKTEDEAVIALHDNGLDVTLTVEAILEGPLESWSTTGKKKKNRANSVNKKEKEELVKNGETDGGDVEWDETITPVVNNTTQNNGGFSERRGRGRGGRGGYSNRPRPSEGQRFGESRKWRERDNKENEKNLAEDGASGENRNFRSDSRGSRRGMNGPRYNGRSRGTRMFQNSERGNSGPGGGNNSGFSQPIDTWFNPTAKELKKENWDTFPSPEDWDNEEYTGSLADTKVFTPSGGAESTVNNDVDESKPKENAYLEVEDWNDAVQSPNQQAANNTTAEKLVSIANSKTLTPEQSQYLSSLTQESQLKKVVTQPPVASTTFNSHPPVEFVSSPFEENSMGPGKKPTLRARIPPPSKIPLSAVEMPPDDSSVNINFLDVSFGAVDLSSDAPQLCDPSLDQNALPSVVKYDDSVAQKVDSVLAQTEYSAVANQAAIQNQRPPQVNQAPQPSTKIGPPPGVPPPADYLSKQNAAVNPYQNVNAANAGQPTSMYNSSVYSNNPQGISTHSSLYGTTASNIGVNSANPHIPQLSQSNHSILNANYPQTAAQAPFPSYTYQNPGHSYQASGMSYPIPTASNIASMYSQPSTFSNYNNIHQNLHQTANTNNLSKSTASLTSTTNSTKDSIYEQSQSSSSNALTSSASNSAGNNVGGTTSSIGLTQSTLLASKTTTPTSIPPGVGPIVSGQYILSQQGIPGYYHQSHPVMYSDEHLQMVQSRLPHHMTNFYSPDQMYPSVSSSLTGRETAGTGISNVAGYSSLTDSRFARTDNASPVQSTLSQQTGALAHQQTLLNPPITPSYTYYYGQSVIPANPFQYGTMYPMAPAASATSHGTGATNTMSGYNKTATAPAGYNNVYETLGSSSVTGSTNDYGSSSKVGVSGQQTSQAQVKTNSSDLAAMYSSKSTLNKVSPYDKQQQSFQSPPPFSVTLNNGGVGGHHSGGSYAPVFISPLPPGNPQPHHIAPLHHQIDMRVQNRQGQELTNGTSNMSRNQSVNPTATKNVKQNYSQGGSTPYWNSN